MSFELIAFLLTFVLCSLASTVGQAKDPTACNAIIQLGIVKNLISTGKLAEHFPGLSKESLDFIRLDAEKTLQQIAATPAGKSPSAALMNRLKERTDVTLPSAGRKIPVEGRSDLVDSMIPARKAMGQEEERVADALGNMGFKVKFNDGGQDFSRSRLVKDGLNGARTPDLTVEGKIFDIYSHNRNDLDRAVQDVVDKVEKGQTHRVIVNLRENENTESFIAGLGRRLRERNPDGLHEVLVIHSEGGGALSQLVHLFP